MESFKELCFRAMVELGAGRYQGMQQGIVLFCGPCGSTLGLTPDQLSADAVRKAIATREDEHAASTAIQQLCLLPGTSA